MTGDLARHESVEHERLMRQLGASAGCRCGFAAIVYPALRICISRDASLPSILT
jgi:hypothetical protein